MPAFSNKSSASFGFSVNRRENFKKPYFWKSKVSVVILLFVIFLVISYFFKHAAALKPPKSRKIKRHLEMLTYDQGLDGKTAPHEVHIIPERLGLGLKRWGVNPPANDGNVGKATRKGIRWGPRGQRLEGRFGPPRAFEVPAEKHLSGREEVGVREKTEEERKILSGLAKGFVPTVRLKGIYMQSVSKRGNHLEEKFNINYPYSKEINNLLQRGFGSKAEEGKWTLKKVFKVQGAPFKLPEEKDKRRRKIPEMFAVTQRGHPLTIFLDFYPMNATGNRYDDRKLSQTEQLPGKDGSGIIMKLNLYPRKGGPKGSPRKVFERHLGPPIEEDNNTPEKRSFGWFSSRKKKRTRRPKECSIMGLNPHGKHITAKWKDENGDWIHAKRVAVKYREEENNKTMRK